MTSRLEKTSSRQSELENAMEDSLFAQLAESMEQMGEIVRGERMPSREFDVSARSEGIDVSAVERSD